MPFEPELPLATAMRTAAQRLLAALDADQRAGVTGAFGSAERRDWTYLPGVRPGLRLGALTAEQRDLALDLLHTAFSRRGVADLQLVVAVEEARRALSSSRSEARDPVGDPAYWVRLLGSPTDPSWAWRISGHHLVAQATVVEDVVALTPQFFGAQPARVLTGPHAGLQALPREQDLARELVLGLQEDQRRRAVASAVAPADILSRFDPVLTGLEPAGLPQAAMDRRQSDLLEALVRQYLDRAPAAVADPAWAAVQSAGWGDVRFTWSGPLQAGQGHYYAVTGPSFVLEYDNTQDDANHIHCVWRDRGRDFGADLLAEHYRTAHGGQPPT